MSLIWADGFEHWGNTAAMSGSGYQFPGNTNLILNNAAFSRTGRSCLELASEYRGRFRRDFPNTSMMTFGAALRFQNPAARNIYVQSMFLVNKDTTRGVKLSFDNDGSLILIDVRNDAVLFQTPVNTYTRQTWFYYELQLDCAAKVAKVRVNNKEIISVAFDPQTPTLNSIGIGGKTADYSDGTVYVADIYVTDGAAPGINPGFIGDIRCRTVYPNANGPNQQWPVTGAASAVAALDNVPFNANEYIAAANVGDVSNFELTDIPANTSYVVGVVIMPAMAKTDAGVCEVAPQITSGATTIDCPVVVPTVAPVIHPRVVQADPNTGVHWTKDAVNAMRVGFKRTV